MHLYPLSFSLYIYILLSKLWNLVTSFPSTRWSKLKQLYSELSIFWTTERKRSKILVHTIQDMGKRIKRKKNSSKNTDRWSCTTENMLKRHKIHVSYTFYSNISNIKCCYDNSKSLSMQGKLFNRVPFFKLQNLQSVDSLFNCVS